MEDYEGPCVLGRGAAGRGVGQADAGQRDPVCQGCFLGQHQDEMAISEALGSGWVKGRAHRLIRTLGFDVHAAQTRGDGLGTISI